MPVTGMKMTSLGIIAITEHKKDSRVEVCRWTHSNFEVIQWVEIENEPDFSEIYEDSLGAVMSSHTDGREIEEYECIILNLVPLTEDEIFGK